MTVFLTQVASKVVQVLWLLTNKMIFLKTEEEIELLRESNLLVCKTLAELAKVIQPGVTTAQLDRLAEEFIRDNASHLLMPSSPSELNLSQHQGPFQ